MWPWSTSPGHILEEEAQITLAVWLSPVLCTDQLISLCLLCVFSLGRT